VRIIDKAGKWSVGFTGEVPESARLALSGKSVGIDLGLSALLTTSDGEQVDNPNYDRTSQRKLGVLQRGLARAKRASKNRRKARLWAQRQQEQVASQRRDLLHKLRTSLVQGDDGIALEAVRVRNRVRNTHLSKSSLESGGSMFRQFLTDKAANAGRAVAFVNPAFTSKCCSNGAAVFQDLTLSTGWGECDCGLSLDRDPNAAVTILRRTGWDTPVPDHVERG
jgi:putative transposase